MVFHTHSNIQSFLLYTQDGKENLVQAVGRSDCTCVVSFGLIPTTDLKTGVY